MDAMLSRITLFSLLLALMLGLGIVMQTKSERDRCNSYAADGIPPRSEYVVTGTREVEVPCNDWWMRQSQTVQVLCIADAGLGMIFAVNALGDLRRGLGLRRARKLR
ncbi:MAG TPA: hypothetical protein VII58_03635 [Acidobacteriaceae bacterium]